MSKDALSLVQPNAKNVYVSSEEGLLLISNTSGTLVNRIGATEVIVNGFEPDAASKIKVGEFYRVGGTYDPYGVGAHQVLERQFSLDYAKAVAVGSGTGASSAIFIQVVAPPAK